MPSKRTLASKSSLDSAEARNVLASIKRDLRRVQRDVRALQPVSSEEPEQPISWDIDQQPSADTDKFTREN